MAVEPFRNAHPALATPEIIDLVVRALACSLDINDFLGPCIRPWTVLGSCMLVNKQWLSVTRRYFWRNASSWDLKKVANDGRRGQYAAAVRTLNFCNVWDDTDMERLEDLRMPLLKQLIVTSALPMDWEAVEPPPLRLGTSPARLLDSMLFRFFTPSLETLRFNVKSAPPKGMFKQLAKLAPNVQDLTIINEPGFGLEFVRGVSKSDTNMWQYLETPTVASKLKKLAIDLDGYPVPPKDWRTILSLPVLEELRHVNLTIMASDLATPLRNTPAPFRALQRLHCNLEIGAMPLLACAADTLRVVNFTIRTSKSASALSSLGKFPKLKSIQLHLNVCPLDNSEQVDANELVTLCEGCPDIEELTLHILYRGYSTALCFSLDDSLISRAVTRLKELHTFVLEISGRSLTHLTEASLGVLGWNCRKLEMLSIHVQGRFALSKLDWQHDVNAQAPTTKSNHEDGDPQGMVIAPQLREIDLNNVDFGDSLDKIEAQLNANCPRLVHVCATREASSSEIRGHRKESESAWTWTINHGREDEIVPGVVWDDGLEEMDDLDDLDDDVDDDFFDSDDEVIFGAGGPHLGPDDAA